MMRKETLGSSLTTHSTTDKKLVWFCPRLLRPYVGYRSNDLNKTIPPIPNDPKLDWNVAMYKIAPTVTGIIDHTGFSKNYGDGVNLEIVTSKSTFTNKIKWNLDNGKHLNDHFDDMINDRADKAYKQAQKYNFEYIYLAYGGGIDSCTLLAAMLQHPKSKHYIKDNKLIIKTTKFAEREDPLVWRRIVEMNLPMEFMNYDDLQKDNRNWMLVTGDVEPVWGSCYATLPKGYISEDDMFAGDWKKLYRYFISKDTTGLAWLYFRDLMATAPFEIKTCFQAWWWYEWCTNTQCYMFRICTYSDCDVIKPEMVYPGNKQFWFLADNDMFDHGAYVTANRLIPEDMSWLKIHSLNYLAKWMQWSEPRGKPKIFSQYIIPKRIRKMRVWNDLSWDVEEDILKDA